MGNQATLIGVVALAAALVGLLFGFLWGRSRARAQVEQALDKARVSSDAREFDLLEQLSSKMFEVSELRARTEELPRLQAQLEQLKSQQMRGSAGIRQTSGNSMQATLKPSDQKQEPSPVVESADKTIQNYLKSLEEKLKHPEEPQVVAQKVAPPPPAKLPAAEPTVAPQQSLLQRTPPSSAAPPVKAPQPVTQQNAPPKIPDEKPRAVTPQIPRPPAASPAVKPPPAKDEWQEFAASLEALTRQQK